MKKIAITQRLISNNTYPEVRDALDLNWPKLFSELGFLAIILPTEGDIEEYYQLIGFDGIILSGGNDLFKTNPNSLSQKRDAFEKKVISFAIKNNIPLLGVCRGMQIIGDFFGNNSKPVNRHTAVKHELVTFEDSKLRIINLFNG